MALNALRFFDRTLSITIDYTRDRKAFGKSILDNQIVHYKLAELAGEVEALRALTYMAVGKDNDHSHTIAFVMNFRLEIIYFRCTSCRPLH